jgi:type II secretory pathway pseudopilin PulG
VSTTRCKHPRNGPGGDRRSTQAFTITELLVVISIIVLLIAISVPALSGLMNSSERSLAENQLRAALSAARDAAIQSETGDAAAVFLYPLNNNGGGHITVIPCVVAGQIDDLDMDAQGQPARGPIRRRDVLVPIPNIEPIQLPRGWVVSGYAPPGTIGDGTPTSEPWYPIYTGATAFTARLPGDQWVTPETSYFDASNVVGSSRGVCRRSFMVRFKAGTGELDTGNQSTAVVFDPVNDSRFRSVAPFSTFRADQLRLPGTPNKIAPNSATWVKRVLGDRGLDPVPMAGQPTWRDQLLGGMSLDTVLVRPVTELALYEQLKLAASIGAGGLNRTTGTIYGNPTTPAQVPLVPTLDTALFAGSLTAPDVSLRVSQWIEGRYPPANPVASDARIFTVQRYLGQIQEVVP